LLLPDLYLAAGDLLHLLAPSGEVLHSGDGEAWAPGVLEVHRDDQLRCELLADRVGDAGVYGEVAADRDQQDIHIADGVLGVEGGDGGDWGGSQVGEGGGGGGGGYGRIKVFYESCNDSSGHSNAGGAGGSGGGYPCDGQDALTGLDSGKSKWKYQILSPVLPYHDSGTLTSGAHDMGYEVDFGKLRWCAAAPAGTEVKFQIATNNDNATWDFVGPDGTASTYYTASGSDIWSGHDGDRYIKYKAFLATSAAGKTPTLSKVSITGGSAAAVGGIAELPEFDESAGSSAGSYIALAGLAAAGAAALGGGAWYARRQRRAT